MNSEEIKKSTLEDVSNEKQSLSKRQMKKAEKRRTWLETKHERRKEEKERRKRKMERIREERGGFVESRSATRKRLKKEQIKMEDSSCKVGVVFDMQFGHLMHQRDLGKCIKQILRCYSQNRRLTAPLQLHITSLNGSALNEMEKHNGYKAWDINFYDEEFSKVLPKDSLVYLSADSDNIIHTLDNNKNYIIGGLVDHNNHKGICLKTAQQLGISHGRLPIDKYVNMKTRHILAVNHVYEIMVQVTQNKSWEEAFFDVIPERKGLVVKDDKDDILKSKVDIQNSKDDIQNSKEDIQNSKDDIQNSKDDIQNSKDDIQNSKEDI